MSIVARIQSNGGTVAMDGHRLRVTRGRLTAAHLAWVRDHADAVRAEIMPGFDAWVERASIFEADAGLSREAAEIAAWAEVAA